MIRAFVSLAALFALLSPPPAAAVSFAECQAFLCMPGGFPPPECSPARSAVLRRIRALLPALPAWSECVAAFGFDPANVSHNETQLLDCPRGGNLSGRTCTYTTGDGCTYSYPARIRARVQVVVDGSTSFSPNHTFTAIARPDGDTYLSGGDPLLCSPGGGGGGGFDSGVIGGPGPPPPTPICEPLTPGCDEDGQPCDPATDPACPGECIPNTPACDEDGNRCDPATDPDCPPEDDEEECDPDTDPTCPPETSPCQDPNRRPSPPVPGTPSRPEGSAYTTPIDTGLTCICPGNYPFPFFGYRGWICLPNPGSPVN